MSVQEEDKGHTTDNSASYAITNGVNVLARGKYALCI